MKHLNVPTMTVVTSDTVQLKLNLKLACTILACCPLFFGCYPGVAHVLFTHNQNDTQMHKNNVSKFSKCEPCHKHKQEHQDIDQHKPYLKVLYNAYMLLLMKWLIL